MSAAGAAAAVTIDIKGIANVSGVSCHVASAIQLLYHNICTTTFNELGTCLMQFSKLANDNDDDYSINKEQECSLYFLQQLGTLLKDLSTFTSNSNESPTAGLVAGEAAVVDPTNFYKALEKHTSIDTSELGDAATALRIILQTTKQCLLELQQQQQQVDDDDENISPWQYLISLLDVYILGGQVQQELVGYSSRIDNSNDKTTTIVGKKVKTKSMTCPFPIQTIESPTLSMALTKATIEPTHIQGYQWDLKDKDDDNNDVETKTTTQKSIRFVSLPQLFLIHLMRFNYIDGKVNVLTNELDIPETLDMASYCSSSKAHDDDSFSCTQNGNDETCGGDGCSCCLQYELTGAILHVQDNEDTEEKGGGIGEENGHYVALVQQQQRQNDKMDSGTLKSQCQWIMLDDKNVHQFSTKSPSDVLKLLSCHPPDHQQNTTTLHEVSISSIEKLMKKKHYSNIAPTVLSYKQSSCGCHCNHTRKNENTTNFIEKFQQYVAWRQRQKIENKKKKLLEDQHDQNPESLVGKRLQIRWSKSKFYAGIVASYNASTGRHCIHYDDGDVKEYTLKKKTIKWV